MLKRKIKIKKKNLILFLGFIIFVLMFVFSLINVILWAIDSKKTDNVIDSIEKVAEVKEIKDNDKTEIILTNDVDEDNPYWDYIKMKMIDVNFDDLLKVNNHTKGWIQVKGTNINYPFVQTKDNDYYLNRSYDKSYNKAGWVFLDFRNKYTDNKNTIIYAHGRTDTTMFGSLKNILKSDWLDNKDNYVVKISTPEENTLWQVFSVYHIKTTSDYIRTDFDNDEDFLKFTKMLTERSKYNFNVEILGNDQILTLSTCYNDFEKMVMHAKLIKRSKK